MDELRAHTQDIRPLQVAIVNLMPTKVDTETQLLRLIGNTPLQVEVELIQMKTHESTHVAPEHMLKFYKYFDDIKDRNFDGLIITGAPIELLPFEEVEYWDELCEIMEWSKTHVYSTFHICWGAQAALYYHYGIPKHELPEKLFGVFPHTLLDRNTILFRGADDPMKLKSVKVPFGYIGITHFEEKDQFAGREEIDMILQSTMRGGSDFWNFETYNPPLSRDNGANMDSALDRADRFQHRSCYLDLDDPSWLGDPFINEAEELKRRDERRYRHEYLGEAVGSGGNVFHNLELRSITDEEIKSFPTIYQGVDWGWFPDPYAFIRLYYDPARETIYLLDEHVGNNMTNEETAAWIIAHGYNTAPIVCDSAEQKSVADYRSLGLQAKPAAKGPGSVDYGMKWLQGRTIVIDPARTPKSAEEFVHYEYERDRNGAFLSGYPDADNHTIDAVRYALNRVIRSYRSNA